LAVDTGLPGFAIWIWLMAAYLVLLIRIVRKTRGAGYFEYGTALGAFGAALAFLLSCITHYILGDGEVMAIMWFLMGITVALDRILVHEQGSTLIAGSERFD
jgi:hypothetical protein